MIRRIGFSYAPVFAGLMLLWPIAAYTGAQGFTIIVGSAAILVWLFAWPKSIPLYAAAFAAFIAWVIASSTWSPASGSLYEGSLAAGDFSVNAVFLRIGLTAFAIAAMIMGAAQVAPRRYPASARILRTIPLVQGVGVIVTALAMGFILNLLAPISDPVYNMPQNLMRNANAYILLLPVLLAWIWARQPIWRFAVIGVILLVSLYASHKTGSESAGFALLLCTLFMFISQVFPRNGVRAMLIGLGGYILIAPLLIAGISHLIRGLNVPIPLSFWSRIYSWQYVGEKVMARPMTGHGIEASDMWRETYSEHPDLLAGIVADSGQLGLWENYPIMPGHPHSMPLQIWAETGLIGASLAALTLFCLARRLGTAETWPPTARLATAGLIGAALSFFAVSYSMWNEAFWCSVALAVGTIIILSRHDKAAE